jgi:hypothetical protein
MSRRSFATPTSSLATSIPLLDKGVYAGVITGAAASGKEDKQYFKVVKDRTWDKNVVNEETGKAGSWIDNLDKAGLPLYKIEGAIYFGATLTSKKAITTLQQDEPRVFGGQIKLVFSNETLALDDKSKENVPYANLLQVAGLSDVDFEEQVDFDYDEEIEVPEEMAHVDGIVDMLNSVVYQRSFFTLVTEALNGVYVNVSVLRQPKYNDKTQEENIIDTGRFNSFCGVTAYTEGDEQDLED